MKIVVRNSVFETNSSSTHSFTITTTKEIKERQERQLKTVQRFNELNKKTLSELSYEEYKECLFLKLGDIGKDAISFQIKSPLAKLVWIKGLIDNAEGDDNDYIIELSPNTTDEEYEELQKKLLERAKNLKNAPELEVKRIEEWITDGSLELNNILSVLYCADPDYKNLINLYPNLQEKQKYDSPFACYVYEFYDALKKEYCAMENITEAEACKRILVEGNKFMSYENILKNENNRDEKIEELLKTNYEFSDFASTYKDKVQALKDFIEQRANKDCSRCSGRLECDHYFSEGILDECSCGFNDFYSIYKNLEKAKKDLSFKEFAKEFITEKFVIVGVEYWNNCCVLESDNIY